MREFVIPKHAASPSVRRPPRRVMPRVFLLVAVSLFLLVGVGRGRGAPGPGARPEGGDMVVIIATVYTGNGRFEADAGDVDGEMISLYAGDTVTLRFLRDSETDDETTVFVDGEPAGLSVEGAYTFASLSGSHTISVGFTASSAQKVTITATSEGPGVILPAGKRDGSTAIRVDAGSTVSFRMVPDRGYAVSGLFVDSVDRSEFIECPYVFENVQGDHDIRYTFDEDWLFRYRYIEDLDLREPGAPVPAGALDPDRIVYRGAFRPPEVPWDPEHRYGAWDYVTGGVSFNPDGDPENADPYPGSLFALGHAYDHMVAEITIPEPVVSKNAEDLPRAKMLQGFTAVDAAVGGNDEQIVALAYLADQRRLYYGGGADSYGDQYAAKHGVIDADLGSFAVPGEITSWVPDAKAPGTWEEAGKWYIEDFVGDATGSYLCEVPAEWAATFTGGRTLLAGRSRWGWGTGEGPRLHAIAPWLDGDPPPAEARLSAFTLLQYEEVEGRIVDLANARDDHFWRGVQWVEVDGERALVFTARLSYGNIWYNHGPFTDHGKSVLRFYDIADLERVARGEIETYEPQPYASLDVTPWLLNDDHQPGHLLGMAWDRESRFLYVLEDRVTGPTREVVFHVFEVLGSPVGGRPGGGDGGGAPLPRAFGLSQNYPNPFNPSTTIAYEIPPGWGSVPVELSIYDVRGRRVRGLVDGERTPGRHEAHWDGKDDRARAVPSGVYLYRIQAGGLRSTRRMVVAR